MATRIIEYGGMVSYAIPVVPASQMTAVQTALTATGTSAQSAAFDAATEIVMVQSDEAVYIAFGTNPTATTDNYRLQAGDFQFFHVPMGKSYKVAVRT